MAVNELDRDYTKLLHMCDLIENIQNGMKMQHEDDAEKKSSEPTKFASITEKLAESAKKKKEEKAAEAGSPAPAAAEPAPEPKPAVPV